MAIADEKTFDRVTSLIEQISGIPKADLLPGKRLSADLDIDSLTLIEIAVAIQDDFDIEVEDERVKELKTIEDVANMVYSTQIAA